MKLHWFQAVGQGPGVESALGQVVCRGEIIFPTTVWIRHVQTVAQNKRR